MNAIKLVILPGLLMLSACSKTFFVDVKKPADNTIAFCFYSDANRTTQVVKTITRLSVLEEQKSGDWVPVWEINGPMTQACVDYGTASNEIQVKVPATTLITGKHYRVAATDDNSPVGYGTLNFSLHADGTPYMDSN